MTVEADIVAALSGLVAGRVYADASPVDTFPRIVFFQIGGQPVNYYSGVADQKNGRFQINTFAKTKAEVARIARQAEDILKGSETLRAEGLGGVRSGHDPAVCVFSSQQDFSIWFDS